MSLVVVVAVSFHSLFLFYYTSAISTMKSPFKPSPLRYMCTNVSILLKIVKDEATGSLCDRNSQGQEENGTVPRSSQTRTRTVGSERSLYRGVLVEMAVVVQAFFDQCQRAFT